MKKIAVVIIIGLTAGTLSLRKESARLRTANNSGQIMFNLQRDLGSAD